MFTKVPVEHAASTFMTKELCFPLLLVTVSIMKLEAPCSSETLYIHQTMWQPTSEGRFFKAMHA
jgi:hypothetical protein